MKRYNFFRDFLKILIVAALIIVGGFLFLYKIPQPVQDVEKVFSVEQLSD